jgi:16S rRNA (cytosine1402-N4)-methyltransferase
VSFTYGKHISVLLNEIIDSFQAPLASGQGLVVDATFGGGGHSFALLEKFPHCKIVGFDQDQEAIQNGLKNSVDRGFADRLELIHDNFQNASNRLQASSKFFKSSPELTGVLADLGISSHQLDSVHRGFSFVHDGPLDMRMNQSEGLSAADVVNQFEEKDLADIFYHYGEERLSRRIAARIIELRKEKLFERTKDLEEVVYHAYPKVSRFSKTHPATRVFQALRIYVNNELEIIPEFITSVFPLIRKGGVMQVISFHSLEDRLVKRAFRELEDKELAERNTKKPIIPSAQEILHNSRSRSAKLRVITKS